VGGAVLHAGPGLIPDRSGGAISFLGIDVGGTKVAFRIEGAAQDRETSVRWGVGATVADDLALLGAEVTALLADLTDDVEAVGVAVPATVGPNGGVVAWPGRPSWIGLDLRATLRGLFPAVEVRHADDGDLAALAEARASGCADLLYLGVGTGVGGGIVIGGRARLGSCEVGHMVIECGGSRCDCGRRGCVQSVGSGPATLRRASALRGAEVSFGQLCEAVEQEIEWAVSALEASAAALAASAISVHELLGVDLVLVGGGFATRLPHLIDLVAEETARLGRPGSPAPPVRAAVLGAASSLRGAVLAARGLVG
jgi:kanosamine 6-kinase